MIKLVFALVGLLLSLQCTTSPTGRTQLHVLSDDQLNGMGAQSFEEMKKKVPASKDQTINKNVTCVVNLLLQRNGWNPSEWEVQVFQDDQVNAFALPGNKIGVYTGMFKTAKNQGQLAAVIGHEIGHVIARHGNERVSQQLLVQGGLAIAQLKTDPNSQTGRAVLTALGLGANFGILLPYSRKHESEADELGVDYMAKAGFDPREAKQLWINMASIGAKGAPEILSTHPDSGRRANDIEARLPEALKIQQAALAQHPAPNCY